MKETVMVPHSEQEYREICERHALVMRTCAAIGCEPGDLARMCDGLMRSVEMLRGERPLDSGSLPKRYRKAVKRLERLSGSQSSGVR